MRQKEIVSVLFLAAVIIALNAASISAQSRGGSQTPGNRSDAPENKESKNLPPHEDQSIGSSQSGGSESTTQTSPSSESRSRGSRDSSSGQEARSASQGIGQQDVRQAQEALKNQGHDPGPVDGIMGSQTRQALRAFQSKNGLKQTGMLDAETKSKLNILHSGVYSDRTPHHETLPGSASGFAPKESGPMSNERSPKQKESSSR